MSSETEFEEFQDDLEQRAETIMKITYLAIEAWEIENDRPFDVDPAIFSELLERYQAEEKYDPMVTVSMEPGERLIIRSKMGNREEAERMNQNEDA